MIAYITAILIFAGIYALLGLALNLQWGHTGLANLGFVGFFAIGAYVSALLALNGVPLPIAALAAAGVAGFLVYPLGLLTLRLGEDTFAIVTFGLAETVRVILYNADVVGASNGLTGVPLAFSELAFWRPYAEVALIVTVVAITVKGLQLLLESPYGRVLRAIRENDLAARSLGKDTRHFKLVALVLGSLLAGLAGSLYAHYVGYLSPDQFSPTLAFTIFTGVALGGSSNLGASLGTLVLIAIMEATRFLSDFGVPIDANVLAQVRVLLVGIALILLMRFRRQGLRPYVITIRSRLP